MKRNHTLRTPLWFCFFSIFLFSLPTQAQLPLVPYPAKAEALAGSFPLSAGTLIQYPKQAPDMELVIANLQDWIATLPGSDSPGKHNMLAFRHDPGIANPEGYRLEVGPGEIRIEFSGAGGAFYALTTLRQLADAQGNIPCVRIEDQPRYSYRGMHLDCGRHWRTAECGNGRSLK